MSQNHTSFGSAFGDESLNEPYYLRPTGETQVYPMASRWIHSYRDLPLKVLTVQPMFRAYKGGVPLLSGQGELMADGHAFFTSSGEAKAHMEVLVERIDAYLRSLGLNTLVVDRPIWGNNPVAERTIGFDLPLRDRTMMVASLYLQGDRYARAYDINYRDEDNETNLVQQVSWGVAVRVLGLHLLANGDDRGFFPQPNLSPVEVAFLPVTDDAAVLDCCERLADAVGLRTAVDSSDRELWEKFERWEARGVPLRVEIGPDEVKSEELTVFRRDTNERVTVPAEANALRELSDDVKLGSRPAPSPAEVESMELLEETVEGGSVAAINYCGREACGREIESGIPGEILGMAILETDAGRCLNCGNSGDLAYFSRRH